MFSIKIQADGKGLARALNYIDADLKQGILVALRNSARGMAANAKRRIRASKRARALTSDIYPHSDTGALARSIGSVRQRRKLAYVVYGRFYGRFLEFGTVERTKRGSVKPMPFFLPTDAEAEVFNQAVEDAVVEAIRIFSTR